MIGKKVKTNILIQSDDRLNGIDDGTEVIPAGSVGVIYANASDFLSEDEYCASHWHLVEFELPNGKKQTFDLLPEEFTLVEE